MEQQEKTSANGKGEAAQNHSDTFRPAPVIVSKPEGSPPQEPATAQELAKKEKEMTGFEKATLRWAKAAVIMSALAAIFVCLQWWEMHNGGQDTHDLAIAAGKQATWTQNLAANMQMQADRTKDLADRMKDQSNQTKVIANQAITQASAAKSAAETAKEALHISERAYIIIGLPILDTTAKDITIPVLNTGHIPSGKVVGTVHEFSLDGVDPTGRSSRNRETEAHWKHYELSSVPTSGQTMNFIVSVPSLNIESLNTGHENIVVVGIISYNDGFPDDPAQQWPFCEGIALLPRGKNLQWEICNPVVYLPRAINADHYPENESPN